MFYGICVLLLALLQPATAVLIGDEHHVSRPRGKFYSFGENEIAIIDPETGAVTKTLPVETTSWADVVYMERGELQYLFANDRGNHQVVVIDTVKEQVVHRVDLADGVGLADGLGFGFCRVVLDGVSSRAPPPKSPPSTSTATPTPAVIAAASSSTWLRASSSSVSISASAWPSRAIETNSSATHLALQRSPRSACCRAASRSSSRVAGMARSTRATLRAEPGGE